MNLIYSTSGDLPCSPGINLYDMTAAAGIQLVSVGMQLLNAGGGIFCCDNFVYHNGAYAHVSLNNTNAKAGKLIFFYVLAAGDDLAVIEPIKVQASVKPYHKL